MDVELGSVRLTLLPQHAIWRPETSTVYVADLHWGKEADWRAQGLPVGNGPLGDDLQRLSAVLQQTGAQRLVVLGDLLHARASHAVSVIQQVQTWREGWPELEWLLVRGNHDRRAGDPPAEWGLRCVDEPHSDDGVLLRHYPPAEAVDEPTLSGHWHPTVRLRVAGERLTVPCFCQRALSLVLPAFSSLARGQRFPVEMGDRIFPVTAERVFGDLAHAAC
jgi:uncharacterized protein